MSGRDSRGLPPRQFKVLCVSSLHSKASDDVIRDTLYREYKKYGDISVRVVLEPDERVAYVYFRNFDDAVDAWHSKSRVILFDKPAVVEPVYESRSSEHSKTYNQRTASPPPYPRYRSRSPPRVVEHHYRDRGYRDDHQYHHQTHYHHRGSNGHEYYQRGEYLPRGYRGRGNYMGDRGRGGYHRGARGGAEGGPRHYEPRGDYKKERFPNYLTHVQPEDDPMSTRNLFVGNLEVNITSDELRKIFGAFGNVTDIDVKRPPPGSGNAFAFVRYENLDMAHSAKQELSGQFIGKFQCKIGYGKAHPTPKIWVGQLGSWCSESLLWKEFDRFGAIKSIEYLKGDNFAYILYEMVDAAQAAVQEMRGFPLGGPDKRLRLDFADVEGFPEETATHHDTDNGKRIGYTSGSKNNYNDQDKGDYHLRRRENESGDRLRSREDDRSGDLRRESHLIVAQTVSDLCRKTPNVWDGGLILKNSLFPTRLHLIDGSRQIADSLKDEDDNNNLKIMQRLRLDQSKLDDVNKRIANSTSHAIFLGVPASMSLEHSSPEIQSRHLRNLVTYLKQKEAAGVISMTLREYLGDTSSVLYCFPPCEYARDLLQRRDCNLTEEVKEDFLIVVVVCGSRA